MKIDFVIRTLNEERGLQRVLDSIKFQKTEIEVGVIIVDSGSTDNTLVIAENAGCKVINIRQDEWSWGRALNLGIEYSNADYIGIISGHCYLSDDKYINNAIIKLNDGASAVYGRQIPLMNYDPFEEIELEKWYPEIEDVQLSLDNLVGVSNACCVMKRSAWSTVKFDEYAESMEDGIWAVNALKIGLKLKYSSSFSLFHSHPYKEDYVYRKWYARTLEGLKFAREINKASWKYRFKNNIKKYIYGPFYLGKESCEILEYFIIYHKDKKQKINSIFSFYRLKFSAIKNAHKDFYSDRHKKYWQVI